ncbi:NAD+ synthase [Actinocatenispora sera]|uniref:Glutamine-dependent NAD(+) synthetase n=1 Tax=Actinocatenispora sera TaxID=390989 RepID=A0A810L4Y7_9ACTN|nr:NAD+ synthase [Actinocatenispora sera]BCJ29702.1 NAD+ synthase [Actinocatenispora sera]
MPTLRLALAQVDPTVGDLTGNARIVRDTTRRAADAGAQLVAFPEMMLTGYPVEDLVFRESFVRSSRAALEALAADLDTDGLGGLAVLVGYLDADGPSRMSAEADPARGPRNALALLSGGRVVTRYFKHHLPNYGVFDEDRYFVPGNTLQVVRIGGVDVALTICEDLWQAGGPFAAARIAGAGLVVNVNGSPYELNKDDVRAQLCARRAAEAGATLAYVNMVGAQDELVFDGDSIVVGADGVPLARAAQFAEELMVLDLDLPAATGTPPAEGAGMAIEHTVLSEQLPTPPAPRARYGIADRIADEEEVWAALVTGLRDYVLKQRFSSVVIALSGGIDSTVVAAIACDAIGAENVHGVSMPSEYSSEHSKSDAADLAERTGLHYRVQPIAPMVDTFLANLELSGMAVENLQARVRGVILMALSNQEGHLVLTTGNKSELAVGYSTLYGDSVGGFNPLKDVPKTLVWQLARWRNADAKRRGRTEPIPANSISKPPSAELRPGQLDTDSLPEYDELDAILARYVDGDASRADLIAGGHDAAVVDRVIGMVDRAEYKRRQSAPGPKISPKAFGRDRRLPITNRYREA